MTDASLGPSHIAPGAAPGAIDATQSTRQGFPALDRHTIQIGVVVGGSALMALAGMLLGSYMMLPFGG